MHCTQHIRETFKGNFLWETSNSGTTFKQKAALSLNTSMAVGFLTNNILDKPGLGAG